MTNTSMRIARGFTLIEMMIVIAIIGLLASVILASLSTSKEKAITAKRVASAKQVQNALEVYYLNNKAYPTTGGAWQSECATWGGVDDWVPGLAPTYISSLPTDPDTDDTSACCYLYRSNGTDYKLAFAYQCTAKQGGNGVYGQYKGLIDPQRDGNANGLQDWNGVSALTDWAIYSPGAANW